MTDPLLRRPGPLLLHHFCARLVSSNALLVRNQISKSRKRISRGHLTHWLLPTNVNLARSVYCSPSQPPVSASGTPSSDARYLRQHRPSPQPPSHQRRHQQARYLRRHQQARQPRRRTAARLDVARSSKAIRVSPVSMRSVVGRSSTRGRSMCRRTERPSTLTPAARTSTPG